MENRLIKINKWLLPFSWLYGIGVFVRNFLFDYGLLKSKKYPLPIISVGNLTVGGTGKTPHTEYIVELLRHEHKIAVLSRGYKRKTTGFVLGNETSTVEEIGDEPYQLKQKFSDIYVAVDEKRCRGIEQLSSPHIAPDMELILLDDAYQHRYVNPGLQILLIDYNRLASNDALLPAGRLREPFSNKKRANIVIVTKCPLDFKPFDYRIITKALSLYPYQKLYFSSLQYGELEPVFEATPLTLKVIRKKEVLLLTGIASPEQMKQDLTKMSSHIETLAFADHHQFTAADAALINRRFAEMKGENKVIITTEKDMHRLRTVSSLSDEVRNNLYMLPIQVSFLRDQQDSFNQKIINYVRKGSRNSQMAQR